MKILWISILLLLSQFAFAQGIVINEFVASSDSLSGIADEFGEYDDWIELYNNSSEELDLSGYYLSDNFETPDKWQIPNGISIAGNGFLIIWADDDDAQGDLHTNYKLNKQGEEILLSDPSLNILDSISYDDQETNVSMARIPNGTGPFVPRTSTFNSDNGTVAVQDLIIRKDFLIYPNPAKGSVSLDFSDTERDITSSAFLTISDALGRKLIEQKITQWSNIITVELEGIAKGLYFVHIQSEKYLFIKPLTIQTND